MKKKPGPNYRWYILTLTMLTYGVIAGVERLCMPVLFKQISVDLHLSVTAVGTIWGMDPLAGIFIGLPAGLLADRFGVKRTITVVCILAGIFCALRGLSTNFFTMALTMFLFGFLAASAPSIVPKVTAVWFSGERLGLANGLLNVAWSLGSMVATLTSATILSPWLGGWRNVLFFFGAPAVVIGLLWLFTGKEPERSEVPGTAAVEIPFKQALSHVIRIKEVWIIGIITLFLWGASMGFIGYLPLYLRNNGWTTASADSAITVFNGMYLLGSIPMVLLSDKLKSRKGVLLVSIASLAASLAVLPFMNGTGVWMMLIFCGFMRSGSGSLFNIMLFETKSIGGTYGGTATGLANTISMVGAFIAPPIGNSLASVSRGLPFIFWGCLAALGIPLLLMLKTEPKRV
jgi:NNP family nitrate/nitrite transporter-like MFS transporter